MSKPTVAILGASADRGKFGNKSVRAHLQQGYDVYPVNPRGGQIEGLRVYESLTHIPVERLTRISVYLSPSVGITMLEKIAAKPHDQLFFNPGSESGELMDKARQLGLDPILACSIVDLGVQPAEMHD